jgi:hypothetical protein
VLIWVAGGVLLWILLNVAFVAARVRGRDGARR